MRKVKYSTDLVQELKIDFRNMSPLFKSIYYKKPISYNLYKTLTKEDILKLVNK